MSHFDATESLLKLMPEILKMYKNFFKKYDSCSTVAVRTLPDSEYGISLQYDGIEIDNTRGGKICIEIGTVDSSFESSYDSGLEECDMATCGDYCQIFLTTYESSTDIAALYNHKTKTISFPDGYENDLFSTEMSFGTDEEIAEVFFKAELLSTNQMKTVHEMRRTLDIIHKFKELKFKESVYVSMWNDTFPENFHTDLKLPKF